jgi:hypothetical protein
VCTEATTQPPHPLDARTWQRRCDEALGGVVREGLALRDGG